MKRSTKLILGVTIALVTATGLRLTVGHRYHRYWNHRYDGHRSCENHRDSHGKWHHERSDAEPLKDKTN